MIVSIDKKWEFCKKINKSIEYGGTYGKKLSK